MSYGDTELKQAAFIQQAQNQGYANQLAGASTAPAPLTVSSAFSRMQVANERLSKARESLSHISDLIGGPRPTPGQISKDSPPPSGAVQMLNMAADRSNEILTEIEDLINCIARSLG